MALIDRAREPPIHVQLPYVWQITAAIDACNGDIRARWEEGTVTFLNLQFVVILGKRTAGGAQERRTVFHWFSNLDEAVDGSTKR